MESVLRHPIRALVPVVVLVSAGLALGLTRPPVYTAEARINVGRVDVPAYTLQGVTIGNATLASSYARALEAPAVIERAARAAGISAETARSRLTSSHLPHSTLIRVEATGDAREEAQKLSNAAARALIDYVTKLNVRQQDSSALRRFRRAQARVERVRSRSLQLVRRRPRSRAAENARLDLQTAELHARTVGERVLQATVAPPAENLLQLVVPAATAKSDEASVLQRSVLIGLVAGLVLGVALALLRANRGWARRARGR